MYYIYQRPKNSNNSSLNDKSSKFTLLEKKNFSIGKDNHKTIFSQVRKSGSECYNKKNEYNLIENNFEKKLLNRITANVRNFHSNSKDIGLQSENNSIFRKVSNKNYIDKFQSNIFNQSKYKNSEF